MNLRVKFNDHKMRNKLQRQINVFNCFLKMNQSKHLKYTIYISPVTNFNTCHFPKIWTNIVYTMFSKIVIYFQKNRFKLDKSITFRARILKSFYFYLKTD